MSPKQIRRAAYLMRLVGPDVPVQEREELRLLSKELYEHARNIEHMKRITEHFEPHEIPVFTS